MPVSASDALQSAARRVHGALYPAVQRVRQNRRLLRPLFDVDVPVGVEVAYDTTTVALRLALSQWWDVPGRILELGVGSTALLSAFVARQTDRPVDGVDISAERVSSAQRVVTHNNLDVRIWQSDLFEKVEDEYGLIFSNPPYVPTRYGESLDLTKKGGFDADRVWDGGEDGADVLRRIIAEAEHFLAPNAMLLLGAQSFYVKNSTMLRLVTNGPLQLVKTHQWWWNPSLVWALRKR